MGVHGADRVRIHAQHLRIGKFKFQRLLNFLGSHAQGLHGAATFGAPVAQPLGMAAVVAHEPAVGAVEGQAIGAAAITSNANYIWEMYFDKERKKYW